MSHRDRPRPDSKSVKTWKTGFERIGIRIGKGWVSTAKDRILGVSQDYPARREEGNFEKRKQKVLYGHCRHINDARVFLEQN